MYGQFNTGTDCPLVLVRCWAGLLVMLVKMC